MLDSAEKLHAVTFFEHLQKIARKNPAQLEIRSEYIFKWSDHITHRYPLSLEGYGSTRTFFTPKLRLYFLPNFGTYLDKICKQS